MKRVLRWLAGLLLLLPILLAGMLVLTLYMPPVQQWGARWGAQWIGEHTGYGISYERVRVRFPLQLQADGLCLTRDRDTLVWIDRVRTDMLPRTLLEGYVSLPYLQVDNVVIHTGAWMPSVEIDAALQHLRLEEITYRWEQRALQLHDISMDDAAVAVVQGTTTKRDSTAKGKLPLTVRTDKARMTHIKIRYTAPRWELSSTVRALSTGRLNTVVVGRASALPFFMHPPPTRRNTLTPI